MSTVAKLMRSFCGEEATLLGAHLEPLEEFLKGDLAIGILVELLKSLLKGAIVEFLFAADLAVELRSDCLDFILFEEFGAILIEGSEKFCNNLLELLDSNLLGHFSN